MKHIRLIIVIGVSFLFSCNQIDDREKISCYVGSIRTSWQSDTEVYDIFISLRMVNNSYDTIFRPTIDSLVPFPRSVFVGRILHDNIEFREWKSKTKILPKDSIVIRLICLNYRPKTNDSIFLRDIESVNIEYELPESTKQSFNKYIKEKQLQRTSMTRFEVLGDNQTLGREFRLWDE